MDGDDRLSALSDDLLGRILHFVPVKEAASTSVLSRRWGPLWRSSGAVNLAVRVNDDERDFYHHPNPWQEAEEAFFSRRDAFVAAAEAMLAAAAAAAPVTRLTLLVETDDRYDVVITKFLHYGRDRHANHDVLRALVSHPAARRVEELCVAAVHSSDDRLYFGEVSQSVGTYSLVSLPPSETLRVLDLTSCGYLALSAPIAFPRLATLRLRLCSVETKDLQALMDAAPELATVHLNSVFFTMSPPAFHDPQLHGHTTAEPAVVHLRCLAAAALVLELCGFERGGGGGGGNWAIEVDAPRLRSFRYKGMTRRFLLRSPALDMARVDLHFLPHARKPDKDAAPALFWQFVRNFTSARALKLKVNHLKDIAAIGKFRRAELLCAFPDVESLQLEGAHRPTSKTAAVAIANLLLCCPGVRDLTLRLSTVPSNSEKDSRYGLRFLERKDELDYNKSVDGFKHRTSKPATIAMDDNSGGKHDEVPDDIPGLTGRSFACLQSSLRRVGLQFRLDEPSCLGVRLLKFFADNAVVLEEMRVDTGNRRLCEHMNLNLERWIAAPNSSRACLKRKVLAESSWEFSKFHRQSLDSTTELARSTTGFTLLPLQRIQR